MARVQACCAAGLCISCMITSSATTAAKTVFYGPTPYLSQADSPFDLSGLGMTFWLEDFEDGTLNTPGVSGDLSISPVGLPFTDSVDADDGLIDGDGSGGAARGGGGGCTNAEPPYCWEYAKFDFSESLPSGFPRAVGFVWTDGVPYGPFGWPGRFEVNAYDADGVLIVSQAFEALGNPPQTTPNRDTPEDVFFGVRHDAGISRLELEQSGVPSSSFEFDHLQYGYQVPEPSAWTLAVVAGIAIALWKGR